MQSSDLFPTLRPVLGAADLADALFGDRTKSSVITNWRARIADFPPERRKGEFDLVAVHDWMQDNRRDDLVRLAREGKVFTPLWWWAQSVRAYADAVGVGVARRELLALVLLAHRLLENLDPELLVLMDRIGDMTAPSPDLVDDLSRAIPALASRIESRNERVRGLLVEPLGTMSERGSLVLELLRRLLDAVRVPAGFLVPGPILESVLGLREEQRRTKRPETATPSSLAGLMARAADADRISSVLDPACGEGELLVAAFELALRKRGRALGDLGPREARRYAGCEIDGRLVAAARTRLDIVDCIAEVRSADFLEADPFGDELFDVVLVDPPMPETGSRKLRSWMGKWLVAALRHTADNGRVVMLLPNDVLPGRPKKPKKDGSNPPADEPLEAPRTLIDGLLPVGGPTASREFRVEHVVLLPRRIRTDIDGGTCLVVLHVGKSTTSGWTTRLSDYRSLDLAKLDLAGKFLHLGEPLQVGPLITEIDRRLEALPSRGWINPAQRNRLRAEGIVAPTPEVQPDENESAESWSVPLLPSEGSDLALHLMARSAFTPSPSREPATDSTFRRLRRLLTPLLDSAPDEAEEIRLILDQVEDELASLRSDRKPRTKGRDR